VFFVLASILVSAVWSNVHVYAQSPATGGLPSKSISPELRAIMCDPSNPDLKVVNTTEARMCGIPKTVKPGLPSATPQPSPVASSSSSSSSSNPATTTLKSTATKPVSTTTTTATGITVPLKPQQTVTTKNINAIAPSTVYITWATISLLSNTSSLPPSTIEPQNSAVGQQQKSPLIPIARVNSTTGSNGTAGQNYTFAATSPIPSTSDQLIYLGYNGDTKSSHGNGGSKHDDSSDSTRSTTRSTSDSSSKDKVSKLSATPRIKTFSTDFDSTEKKKTSSGTKVDKTDRANDDPKPSKLRSTKTTSDGSSTAKKKSTQSDDGSSEDKSKSDSKIPRIKIIATNDNHSTAKKKKSTSANDESSSEDKKIPNTESSSDHVADSLKKRTKLDTTDTIINDDVGSKGDGDSATKLSGHHARTSSSTAATDHDSIEKNIVPPTSDDSGSNKDKSNHSDDGIESSLSDLGSTIRNKVHSIIRDSLGEAGHSLFGFSDNGGF
jgi:trimeric autotransporter adhesin